MAASRTESSGLTRRQFLPVLGAAAVAAAVPRTLAAAPGGQAGKPPTAESFRSAAEIAMKDALPQKFNKFKIELAKRTISRAYEELHAKA